MQSDGWHEGKQGGVICCFNGNWETARQYLELGIGGSILQQEAWIGYLWVIHVLNINGPPVA